MTSPRSQAPLKVDPATEQLISHAAHFLGISDEPGDDALDWLVADGTREEGAPDDFYAALHVQARTGSKPASGGQDRPSAYLIPSSPAAIEIFPTRSITSRNVAVSSATSSPSNATVLATPACGGCCEDR